MFDSETLEELREALANELGGLDKAQEFLDKIEAQDIDDDIDDVIELTSAMNNALVTIGAIPAEMAPDWLASLHAMRKHAAKSAQDLIQEAEQDIADSDDPEELAKRIPQIDVGQTMDKVTGNAEWLRELGIDPKLWLVLNFWVEFNREAAQSVIQNYAKIINEQLQSNFAVSTLSDDDFNAEISKLLS